MGLTEAMAELRAFRKALNRTADAIAGRPPDQWTGWVTYLLEALQDKSDPRTYEAFLESLSRHIDDRLENGEW